MIRAYIIIALYILVPVLIIECFKRWSWMHKVGTVVAAYAVGRIFALTGFVHFEPETAAALTFSKLQSERPLALHDAVLEQDIEIEEGSIYTFYAVPNSVITDRFTIVEAASSGSAITTNCDNLQTANNVHKFIKDGQLYVLRNGSLYNAQGLVVR